MERIYYRCSTDRQQFLQQQDCVRKFLQDRGIDPDTIEVTEEHISGRTKANDRKLGGLIKRCSKGDVIYVSELSRLGRNMNDLFQTVSEACEKGIKLIQCKDGSEIENESIAGKALLFALSLAAEIEVQNITQRINSGLNARREILAEQGFWISNTGQIRTHFGMQKGSDMSAAIMAAAEKKVLAAADWKAGSKGYQWVMRQIAKGRSRDEVIKEFNENMDAGIDGFSTRNGCHLSKGVLSKWINSKHEVKNLEAAL